MELPSSKITNSPSSQKHRILIIVVIALSALLVLGVVFYILGKDQTMYEENAQPLDKKTSGTILIDEQPVLPALPDDEELKKDVEAITPPAEVTNPVENLPDANPLNKAPNPFEEAYRNPFE